MKRFLKWAAVATGAVVVVIIGLYVISRALGPSDQHERALALMSDREPVTGTNAFAALWLMPYDIPPEKVAAIAATDGRRFNALSAPNGQPVDAGSTMANFASVAQGQFTRRSRDESDLPMSCLADPVACLQHVSAREADYQGWRTHNRALIERAALDGTDYYRNPFEPAIYRPSPNFSVGARARRASQALDFVTGDREAAFSGVCHDINTWRRLGTNADTLLVKGVASGFVDGSLRMFAEMLARAPAGESLPPVCEAALAPPRPQELSMCEVMKGEFAFMRSGLAAAGWPDSNLLYDRDGTYMRSAAIMAVGCDEATERAIVNDRPLPPSALPAAFDFSCIRNPVGCILTHVSGPAYQDYLKKAQETGAKMRLGSTVYWLQTHPHDHRPLAERLAARPAELHSPQHPIEIVNGGQALRITLQRGSGRHWDLLLSAPAGQPSATAGAR
ncbi:hypothetical protein ACW7G0_01415 [Lysobacter sp. A286]